jgi:hypothetical protein
MSLFRPVLFGVAVLLLFNASTVRAEAPPDPLRLVSDQADLVVEIKSPRKLIESYLTLAPVKALFDLEPFQEFYDSTNFRRFNQLITYFEKELGGKWPDLVDRLAGGGAVVALKFGPNPPHALFVFQSKDEALLKKFSQLAFKIAEDELARQESKEHVEKGKYRNIETIKVGKEFHAVNLGSAMLFANSEDVLKSAIDLNLDTSKKSLAGSSAIGDARKLLGRDPLAMFWLNMETVRKTPGAKDVFTLPRNENLLTIFFGGILDVAGRSPFVTAGLFQDENNPGYVIRMPRGRDGAAEGISVHIPPASASGMRPLLEPKDVIFSTSFHLDVGKFWENRAKLFNEKNLKEFEEFDKTSGRFLLGTRFSKLITLFGPYQRFVAVHQSKPGYSIKPKQSVPAFALVAEMRDPEKFTKAVDPLLRAGGFLASTVGDLKLKMVEEKHGPYKLVGYRFPEDGHVKGYEADLLLNYSPCFVSVGNQFIASSTIELAHQLIDLLEKEGSNPTTAPNTVAVRTKVYAEGGAEYMRGIQDILLAQTILDRAAAPESAREQVKALIEWVRKLGVLQIEANYNAQDFKYEFRLIPAK